MHIRDSEGNTRRAPDDITVRLSLVEPGPQSNDTIVNVSNIVVYVEVSSCPSPHSSQILTVCLLVCRYGEVASIASSSDTSADASTSGEYQATYQVETSGVYQMDVFLNGNADDPNNHVNGSPFTVNFSPNFTSPALTDVTGAGLEQAEVNATNTLVVTSKDAFGNLQYYPNVSALGQQRVPSFSMDCSTEHPGQDCVPINIGADNFTVRVIGPIGMDEYDDYGDRLWHGRIESYGDGTHALRYTPPYEGNYILEVRSMLVCGCGILLWHSSHSLRWFHLQVNLAQTVPGLSGEYYETMWLDRNDAEPSVSQIDSEIDFDWSTGDDLGPFIGAQYLAQSKYVSARWTGLIAAEYDEVYTFSVDIPEYFQVRMKLDDEWIVEHWNETGIRLDGGDQNDVASGDLSGSYLMRSQILYEAVVLLAFLPHVR